MTGLWARTEKDLDKLIRFAQEQGIEVWGKECRGSWICWMDLERELIGQFNEMLRIVGLVKEEE